MRQARASLEVQGLRRGSECRGRGFNPWSGTIPRAPYCDQAKIKVTGREEGQVARGGADRGLLAFQGLPEVEARGPGRQVCVSRGLRSALGERGSERRSDVPRGQSHLCSEPVPMHVLWKSRWMWLVDASPRPGSLPHRTFESPPHFRRLRSSGDTVRNIPSKARRDEGEKEGKGERILEWWGEALLAWLSLSRGPGGPGGRCDGASVPLLPAQVSLGLPGCPQGRGRGGRSPENLGRLQ